MTEVRFYNNVDDNLLKFAVIISKSDGKKSQVDTERKGKKF